ncbi:MAG: DUF5060 domain-containing protein, partial [Bacteroidia bacterium]
MSIHIKGQSPTSVVVEDKSLSSGIYGFCANGCIISPTSPSHPVAITGTANVTYTAGSCIQLLPGFSVSSLTGSGDFHAHIHTPQFPVVVITPTTSPTTQVGLFDKLELGLDLPIAVKNLVTAYFTNNTLATAVNPFDPDDISIVATFTSPSGTKDRTINGFYFEDFDYVPTGIGREIKWDDHDTPYNFRVRFAPTEVGQWSCSIKVFSPNGKFTPISVFPFPTLGVDCIEFECVPSVNKGYLEIGAHNRQLRYSGTGESFFAIGQNLPWGVPDYWGTNQFRANEFIDYDNEVTSLANNGGNFFRMIMAPWSHGIEFEKLGDYGHTDQTVHPIFATTENRQHQAFELDKLFDLCEQRDIYMFLDLELQSNYDYTDPTVPPVFLWGNYCYNTVGTSSPTDVLSDVAKQKYFERRLKYIIARWGYSTSLGVLELLSEQDNWDGYKPPPPSSAVVMADNNWNALMASYIKAPAGLGDKNHLITTSFADRPVLPSPFDLPVIDITSAHKYGDGKDINYVSRYDYMNMTSSTSSGTTPLLSFYNKPSIFGEMGMDGDEAMEACNDISFHNAMWATAFMGCYGTGLNWAQDHNDAYRAANYPAIKNFFNGVDFETNDFTFPQEWTEFTIPARNNNAEVFALRNFHREEVMGWAHASSNWWGNESSGCTFYVAPSSSDDDFYATFHPYTNKIKITELKIIQKYDLTWYSTRGSGAAISSITKRTNIFGHLKPFYPASGVDPDVAFK